MKKLNDYVFTTLEDEYGFIGYGTTDDGEITKCGETQNYMSDKNIDELNEILEPNYIVSRSNTLCGSSISKKVREICKSNNIW